MVSVACFLDETEPKVKDFYAVCKTLNITMEQAVAGEKGAEYVREWARNDGETWQPPDRIKDVVDVLGHIDDDTLETVRTMVLPLMAKRGGISSKFKSFSLATNTFVINANEFKSLETFTTGSAYLMVVNSSGNGVRLLKGDTLLSLELDTTVLNNGDNRTFAIDMAKAGSKYAESQDVSSMKIGPIGYEKALGDAGYLVKDDGTTSYTADEVTALLEFDVDYIYKVTVLASGKFKWNGKQGGKISLDDEEDE
jgi:hypothetical protein